MKKFTLFYLVLFVFLIFTYGFSGGDLRYPSGAPAGYTGSPGDGNNCTHCHGGTPQNVEGWITSNIPETGYVPGQVYQIKATSTGSGKKGFEVSPQNFAGDILGSLISGSGSKLVGDNGYITHTSTVSSSTAVWDFQWTAPAEGTGDVVFYGAFAIKESHTKLTSLLVHEDNTVSIAQSKSIQFSVYPNPARDRLSITYHINEPQIVSAQLFSLDGKLVSSLFNEFQSRGNHSMESSIGQVERKGVYLLLIKYGNYTFTRKILIE